MAHEGGGDMEQSVADRLRLGLLELAVEADHLRPGDNAVPACETRFLPSVVTSTRRTERLRCTFKEASSWIG